MEVREAMTRKLIVIRPKSSIREAAKKMVKFDIGGLIVIASGFEIKGIITERDILRAFAAGRRPDTEVGKLMKKRVITIGINESLEEAASVMMKHKIKRLPVVDKGRCVGIITASDLVRYEEHLLDKMSILFLMPRKSAQAG